MPIDEKHVNGNTPELGKEPLDAAQPADGQVPEENAEIPGSNPVEFSPEYWERWETDHPEESWIAYVDADGNPQRVPVWRYRQLGL
jgi:hypothetical protein